MCVAYMYVCILHAWSYFWRPEGSIRSLGMELDCCMLHCWYLVGIQHWSSALNHSSPCN